jgi:S1-C subfamily serine protease
MKNMLADNPHIIRERRDEVWEVKVPGGSKIFPSQNLANIFRRKQIEKGIPVSYVSRIRYAQSINPKNNTKNPVEENNSKNRIQLVARAMQKTFMVESINLKEGAKLNGAAFCIAPHYFITCAHVIRKYNKNLQQQANLQELKSLNNLSLIQNETRYTAELVAVHLPWDLALLYSEHMVEPFRLEENTAPGENIFTIGSPHGFENNVSFGTVGGLNRKIYSHVNAPNYIFVDLSAFSGNSGGPIIIERTEKVIAMLTAIVSSRSDFGLNAGLPSEYIKKFCIMNKINIG